MRVADLRNIALNFVPFRITVNMNDPNAQVLILIIVFIFGIAVGRTLPRGSTRQ